MGNWRSLSPDQLDVTHITWMIADHRDVKDHAASIVTTQSAEIQTMQSWLSDWYGR